MIFTDRFPKARKVFYGLVPLVLLAGCTEFDVPDRTYYPTAEDMAKKEGGRVIAFPTEEEGLGGFGRMCVDLGGVIEVVEINNTEAVASRDCQIADQEVTRPPAEDIPYQNASLEMCDILGGDIAKVGIQEMATVAVDACVLPGA